MKEYKYRKTFTFEGKRYVVRGNTQEEVIEKKALKLRDLEESRIILNRSTTVREWTKVCIDTYKVNVSEKTKYNTDRLLENHVLDHIGNMTISRVKPVHCQGILNDMSGLSKDTITKAHQLLNLIFRTARENQLIISEPTSGIVRPEGTVSHRRSITDDERKALLKVCEDVKYIPFLFMLHCGCRPAEALKVRANDITLIEDVMALHIRGTKSKNADRYVPLPLDFLDFLNEVTPGGFDLFAERKSGGEHTESTYRWLVKCLKKDMNIAMGARTFRGSLVPPLPLAEDFTPYDLRHTYCTDLKKAGVPLGIAKDYMGHADISMTANIYSHSDNDTFLAGAECLGIKGVTPGVTLKRSKTS